MVLVIVVTYYPDEKLLRRNISAFIDDVDKVLIWENTPEEHKLQYRFVEHEKVEYCGDGINSISRALNFGWKYSKLNGYEYLLTMDQDSVLVNFSIMKEYIRRHPNEMTLLSPHINKSNIISSPIPDGNIGITRVDGLITSGALFSIRLLDKLGGFNDKLAIDGIDTDLYLRADMLGIPSYRINNCNLIQRFGEPNVRFFLRKRFEFSEYSASRLESILKSHIFLIRKYNNMSLSTKRYIIKHYIIDKIVEIILFENHKISKVKSVFVGIIKGFVMSL